MLSDDELDQTRRGRAEQSRMEAVRQSRSEQSIKIAHHQRYSVDSSSNESNTHTHNQMNSQTARQGTLASWTRYLASVASAAHRLWFLAHEHGVPPPIRSH